MALVIPKSILDTDLYKLTMQQAVFKQFPDVEATYQFTNRSKSSMPFTRECFQFFKESINDFPRVYLTPDERVWLSQTCPYFNQEYLDYLESYRFNPDQVHVTFIPFNTGDYEPTAQGDIEITARGPWKETILWEVPLMACLSEAYFSTVDVDWTYDGQAEKAYDKGLELFKAECTVSEFGTRRRRSFHTQDIVVSALVRASKESKGEERLAGTSNVHLARKYGLAPSGTVAHEWFMGIGALRGYEQVHEIALDIWEKIYAPVLLVALTDTFTTDAFFKDISKNPERARTWRGLRQDSGDPFVFGPRAKELYEAMGISCKEKMIIYSDSLDLEKALNLKKQADELGFQSLFGIGTFLTNDFSKASDSFTKSKALNIVIKLSSVNGKPCVKISDDLTKNTGDKDTVEKVKKLFGLPA
ncbi:nicotinate phosphoribosyltransferase [Dendrothele bispora CBS 962.96]|uniref:Nicotinate phosphoribosyltransferase n=1 Tax=Dendrothele bispora (strain CBS 962.96) TaxID=1314807 RepID=A0A4S8MJ46_DENBC|nr:nicotinate phosphoribosyltransferase [Dendrothele bispora CBS 962.96]